MKKEDIESQILAYGQTLGDFEIALGNTKWYEFSARADLRNEIEKCEDKINDLNDDLSFAPGMTGPLVNFFENELTQEEWNALCVVHRMRLRLNCGLRFDWSKSIDVKHGGTSQIVDEQVFLQKEKR